MQEEKKTPQAEPQGQSKPSDIGSTFGALISGQIPLSDNQHHHAGPTSSSGYVHPLHHAHATVDHQQPNLMKRSGMNISNSSLNPTHSNMQIGTVTVGGGSHSSPGEGVYSGGEPLKGSYRTPAVRHMSGPKTPVHTSLAAFEPSFGQAAAQSSNPPNANMGLNAKAGSYLEYPRVKRARQLVLGGHSSMEMEEGRNTFLSMSVGGPPPNQQQQQYQRNNTNAAGSNEQGGTGPPPTSAAGMGGGLGHQATAASQGPKRGNYKCSKCGQLKKGHICPFVKTKGKGNSKQQQMQMQMQSMAALADSQSLDNNASDHQRMLSATMGPGGMNLAAYNSRMSQMQQQQQQQQQQPSASNHNVGGFAVTPTSQRVKGGASGSGGGGRQRGLSPGTPSHMMSHNTNVFLTPQKQKQPNLTFTIAQGNRIEYRSPRQLAGAVHVSHNNNNNDDHSNYPAGASGAQGGYTSNVVMDEWLSRVFAQLDPVSLLSAAQVCKHWQKVASYVWNYVTDIKLEIDSGKSQLPKVVLKHAQKLESLRLHVRASIDNNVIQELASVGSRSLKTLEITLDPKAKNLVTNTSLQKLSKKCQRLECLTIGGCKLSMN